MATITGTGQVRALGSRDTGMDIMMRRESDRVYVGVLLASHGPGV